jgi:hypothetical protein
LHTKCASDLLEQCPHAGNCDVSVVGIQSAFEVIVVVGGGHTILAHRACVDTVVDSVHVGYCGVWVDTAVNVPPGSRGEGALV